MVVVAVVVAVAAPMNAASLQSAVALLGATALQIKAERDAMAAVLLAIDELWRENHPNGPGDPNPYVRMSADKRMIWSDLRAALSAAGVPLYSERLPESADTNALRDELISIIRSQCP
jgi:hypothetical protein